MSAKKSEISILAWPARNNASENTYNLRLYNEIEKLGGAVLEFSVYRAFYSNYNILHIHWPEGFLKRAGMAHAFVKLVVMTFIFIFVRIIRRKKIVWTVHNAAPHTGGHTIIAAILYRVLARLVDLQIHMSNAARAELVARNSVFSNTPYRIIPHGLYDGEYVASRSRADVLSSLALTDFAYLFVYAGTIAPYKGALDLIEAFSKLDSDDCALVIAGKCDDENYANLICAKAELDTRVRVRFGRLSTSDMADLISASNVAVLPYLRILNSGSLFVPLGLGRQVLVPAMGSLTEMSKAVGNSWVLTYDSPLSKEDLIKCRNTGPTGDPDLSLFSWEEIAVKTKSAYENLLSGTIR